jgi:hypothetical protein
LGSVLATHRPGALDVRQEINHASRIFSGRGHFIPLDTCLLRGDPVYRVHRLAIIATVDVFASRSGCGVAFSFELER